MADIISFKTSEVKSVFNDTEEVTFNVKEMIRDMKERIDRYDPDEMIDIKDWDGECWKAFLEEVCSNLAEMYNEDVWDIFAVMMPMMTGVNNIKGE